MINASMPSAAELLDRVPSASDLLDRVPSPSEILDRVGHRAPPRRRLPLVAAIAVPLAAALAVAVTVMRRRRSKVTTHTQSDLTEAIDVGARDGFAGDFEPAPGGRVQCCACGRAWPADLMERTWLHRVEGESDPDDLSSVSALTCPGCGNQGLLVLPYGPAADENEADIAVALPTPQSADMAPHST